MSPGQPDLLVEMPARSHHKIALRSLSRRLIRNEEPVDRTVVELGIERQAPVDKRFDDRLVGNQIRIVFGNRNRGSPRNCCPVEQGNIALRGSVNRGFRIMTQSHAEAGMLYLKTPDAVVASAEIQLACAQ